MLTSLYSKMRTVALANALLLSTLTSAAICPSISTVKNELGKQLSSSTSISNSAATAPRWSLYAAPAPAFVVTVGAESDVARIVQIHFLPLQSKGMRTKSVFPQVKYANAHGLTFLLQSRGNGWADTFNLGPCGLLINIANLDTILFNANKTLATIQGGAMARDLVNAAYSNDTRFAGPTRNCLGVLGANLGGGLTRAMGLYGAGVDQIVSVNLNPDKPGWLPNQTVSNTYKTTRNFMHVDWQKNLAKI